MEPDKGNGEVVIDRTDYYDYYFQIQQNSRDLMQILPMPG